MQRLIDALYHALDGDRQDKRFYTATIILFTLVGFVLAVSAVAVWPVILDAAAGEGDMAAVCQSLRTAGVAVAGAALIVALAIPDAMYTFFKSAVAGGVVGFIVLECVLLAQPFTLPGVEETNFYLKLLRFMVNLLLGLVACIAPALIGNLLGWLTRGAFTLLRGDR